VFDPEPSRRTVLAGLSTAALGMAAGCSALSNDTETPPYRNWLYDPREYNSERIGRTGLWFESPTDLVATTEHLNPEVRFLYLGANIDPDLARDSVE